MNPHKARVALVCLVLATQSLFLANAGGDDEGGIVWLDDYKAALNRAREVNRPIMVEFYTSWCLYCGKLEKQTLGDPRVVELADEFVCARLDADVRPPSPTMWKRLPSG